jgi:hypothetical protein
VNVFQWVVVAFCTVQLCVSVIRFRRTRNVVSLAFAAGWTAAIVLLLNPTIATQLALSLGIGRGADFVLYTLSFIFLWAHYQHYLRYKRIEESITQLVRELAILQASTGGCNSKQGSSQTWPRA